MKILIVDDNRDSRCLLETILKGNDFTAVSAANGAEALEKLRAQKFDMIISDILMPGMDGYQLCIECKKDEKLKEIPFIFYTATYTDPKDEKFALKLGADRFIRKPAEPDRFIQIIREVLRDEISGKKKARERPLKNESEVFKLYSERLVKKLEKKLVDLKESKRRYHAVFESTGTATLLVNEDTTIDLANQEALDVTGYTPKELTGKKWTEFVAPESLKKMLKFHQLRRQAPEKAPKKYEVKLINKAGEIRHALLDIGMIEGTKQSVVSILDITERRKAEKDLKESEANLRAIFENSPESFILIDTDHKIRSFNKTAYQRERQVIGKDMKIGDSFYEYLTPQEKKDFTPNFQRALAGEQVIIEREIKSKDGRSFWFEFHYSPVYDAARKAIGVFFVVNDINERKQGEREIYEQRKFQQLRAELWKIASKPMKTETELIDKILSHIGPAIDVSRISFLRLNPKKNAYVLENQWHTKEAGPSKNQSISFLKAKLLFGKKYAVLPKDAVPGVKQYITRKFSKDNIFTYIAMPYGQPGKPEGLFTISECRQLREWTQAEIDTLKEIVNIIDLKSDEIKAQREIYESEMRLKEAQALGKIGSWDFDVRNNKIVWSDQTYRLYERNPKLGPPTPDEEAKYYPPEQTRQLREFAGKAIGDGKRFEYDLEANLPSGRTVYFSATMRPVKDKTGEVIRLQGTVQDITKRKMAEEELKQRVEELERFHRLSVGREIQMVELKKQINELSKKLGLKQPYKLSFIKENKNT